MTDMTTSVGPLKASSMILMALPVDSVVIMSSLHNAINCSLISS